MLKIVSSIAALVLSSPGVGHAQAPAQVAPASIWKAQCVSTARAAPLNCTMSAISVKQPLNVAAHITIVPMPKGQVGLALEMPLGLDLHRGYVYKVDGGAGQPIPLNVCLPQGCVAQVALSAAATTALRKGQTLTIDAASPTGEVFDFDFSLAGFGPVLDQIR